MFDWKIILISLFYINFIENDSETHEVKARNDDCVYEYIGNVVYDEIKGRMNHHQLKLYSKMA